jgi:hypothetical protein
VPPLVLFALLSLSEPPFPLDPGTWWEYREAYTEHLGSLDATSDDVTRFDVRGTRENPFLRETGGVDPGSAPIEVGEGWLRLGVFTGEESLPLPLKLGAAAPVSEGETASFQVEAEEEVTVPSGVYLALRCALRTRETVSLLWIAPGVGVVRETEGRPGVRPDLERVLLRWGEALSALP